MKKNIFVSLLILMTFVIPIFSQAYHPEVGPFASEYNSMSDFRKTQMDEAHKNRNKAITIISIVSGIVIVVVLVKLRQRKNNREVFGEEDIANIPNPTPPEHIKRATELIEQGVERETIYQTLKSEGLVGKEIQDAYYVAYNLYLKKQENYER